MINDLKYANENIKLLLKYKRWTQAMLCKKTGITTVTMQRRLNNKVPNWTMMEGVTVAKAFGQSVNDIFFTRMVPKGNSDIETREIAN